MAFTRTETLDTLYTTTWWARRSEISDAVFTTTPFYYLMSRKGRMQSQAGGTRLEIPIEYDTNPTVKWVGKGGTVELTDTDPLTVASEVWRYLAINVTRYGVDEQQNQGKYQIKRMVTVKLDNAKKTLIDKLETSLFTAQTGAAMNGLPTIIADDPTASVSIHGINQSSYSWWRNQYQDMTAYPMDTYLRDYMENMYNTIGAKGQSVSNTPDMLVTTQTVYETYVEECFELLNIQITDKKLADLGFGDMSFKQKPLTWSPACPSGKMYFINFATLFLLYDPTRWFMMTDWKDIPDQIEDRVAQILCALQLICSSRRHQGVLFNLA